MKNAIFSAVLGLGLIAHAGFYSVKPADGGAWRLCDPAGREAFLNGVDHVKWTGHRSERTASAAYPILSDNGARGRKICRRWQWL